MAKYTWESIRKDTKTRDELYAAIEALSQGLELQAKEMDPNKIEEINVYLIARERAPRVREILQRMRELPDEGGKNPDFEDCMANISGMLSEMEKRQPKEYQTLTGIEGFQDLRESCDSMMPAKNTVGAVALDERTFIHSDEPKETIDTMGVKTLAGFLAMNELTEGVEDWRSVPVSEEEYSTKREDYYELLSIYGTTYSLTDDKEFMKSLSAPGKVTSVAQKGYQLFYDSFQNARKEYPEKYRRDVKSDDEKFKKMAFSHFMTLRALEGEVKPDGSIKAVKDSMLKYEAAFDEISLEFMASMPPKKLDALLARGSSDKTVEKEVRKFVANLDKIPEGLPKDVQPSAKERIEALQQKLKAEKDMAAKMRLTAEIIATREMAGAQLGGKGLENRPDPAAVEARTAELAAEMGKVRESDPKAMDKLVAQATSGHGGKMMEAYHAKAKSSTYLEYINKLDLQTASNMDVARLAAATALFITQEKGAQEIANPAQIEKVAARINDSTAFRRIMTDPQMRKNARMGFGLAVVEELKKEQKELDQARAEALDREQAELDRKQIERDMRDPEFRKNQDNMLFDNLKRYGPMRKMDDEVRESVQRYIDAHPTCRAEAMEIIAGNKELRGLTVPKLREVPDELLLHPEKHKAALQKQQGQEKQPEVKQPEQKKDGAEISGK